MKNEGMSLTAKIILTAVFAIAGIGFALIATISPPELLAVWLLYIALCAGGLGVTWAYRLSRSNGAFVIGGLLLGGVVALAQMWGLSIWISVACAAVAGLLVAFQPALAPRLDRQFEEWDNAWRLRRSK